MQMHQLVHTMPFLIRDGQDLQMADCCLDSFARSDAKENPIVVYNQGKMTNEEAQAYFASKQIHSVILGNGENVGIPIARQACFEFVWSNLPDTQYISELHVDMIFPARWANTLTQFLESCEEPLISPGILTASGELHPEGRGIPATIVPKDCSQILRILDESTDDKVVTGFVHPVIHRANVLRMVGGYDIRFLQGKQGFEDDTLLLGYRYYMGRRSGWKPKAYLGVRVFHATLIQRMSLANATAEMQKNFKGLVNQYGAYGLLELADIHQNPDFVRFARLFMDSLGQ